MFAPEQDHEDWVSGDATFAEGARAIWQPGYENRELGKPNQPWVSRIIMAC